ncbi:DUF2855 family protein [Sphingopyxis soli]|uniref:DUF2855 family protein n=1 Tax=Sphingopyxis soli TaxID=592051 RepID=A0ABN1M3F2_9SPHN|nr:MULTISPECIES: DUF2855 family protein [Sphingopyxis]MBJ7498218.1 DUF2855 family protein [Sphingopyxis sp.]HMO73917.1 DUF2855 family protein [Sphingopyxis sp.]HMP43480.1 DUF2855 family protein [Sphingopyxis sp.]
MHSAEAVNLVVDRSGPLPGDLVMVRDAPAAVLQDRAVRLAIDCFSLSANNLTYALLGDRLGYWSLFPRPDPWGMVPAWGFSTVVESRHAAVEVGERLYGLWPMASSAVLEPGRVNTRLIVENAPSRRPLPPAYNSYFRVDADPIHAPGTEERQAVIRPLFITSFLLDRLIGRTGAWGSDTVIVTSASSKTALGLGWLLRRNRPGLRVIGLTSERHRAAVADLGFFDDVATYGALPAITGAAIIDFSGNDAVLASLRERSPPVHLCRVGLTHGRDEPAVPRPDEHFFFAPDAIIAVAAELGPAGFDAALASATRDFIDASREWLAIDAVRGAEAIRDVWARIRFGNGDPTRAVVASF